MRFSSVAKMVIIKSEDGKILMNCLQWNGTPWDGFWQKSIINEEQLHEILKAIPRPKVPEKCTDCLNCSTIPSQGEKMFRCNLEDNLRAFNGNTDLKTITIGDLIDKRWTTGTPDWCKLKEKKGE